ncbi:TlpA disulfide reductase family protein [Flavitalea sp. BT771]|uniref:TlpA disulfide reductase family protein n=1 Tax=Flavitalea sp. BT771 TaxID=3063329 RepID=UPI0026E4057F|nr:TlpA disulfide reductase family protein [Flavitalea sp. BT771]MDO6429651.1 TlpA disulfide reductase family protein [Flavitalea sp. BT771]MDV6218221.1 TlpA disulfide reductase family protein [Flavitalea sp. BT771]
MSIRKTILLAGVIFFSVIESYAQRALARAPFEFAGMISGRDTGIVVLEYSDVSAKWIQDTAHLVNGKFGFKGELQGPTQAYFVGNVRSMSMDDPNRKLLFLEPCKMTAEVSEGDFRHARIAGSRTQQEFEEFNNEIEPVSEAIAAIKRRWPKTGNMDTRSKQVKGQDAATFDSLIKEENQIKYRFIASHTNSFVSPYLMSFYRNDGVLEDSAKKLYNSFSTDVKNSYFGLVVREKMQAHESTRARYPAPAFVRRDSRGSLIRLSSFKGKSYVLLDFWASWCHPCRAMSPHLRELYSTYHSKGLEIISLSVDTDPEKWKRAIAEDSTWGWAQIGKYLNEGAKRDEVEHNYAVISWPTLILIDKQGNIVGRYTGGEDLTMEDLDNKLREVFR